MNDNNYTDPSRGLVQACSRQHASAVLRDAAKILRQRAERLEQLATDVQTMQGPGEEALWELAFCADRIR